MAIYSRVIETWLMTIPGWVPPILARKRHGAVSVFVPDNLLREARRQKGVEEGRIPRVCVLDPDGDILRFLLTSGKAALNSCWACYHTDLYDFEYGGISFGILGCAVGAPFAVLVAEEMFASGCELLISVTSSGQIVPKGKPPFFVLIERALRDEGTSYHYLPASEYSAIDSQLRGFLAGAFEGLGVPMQVGATWTTDAPFRETSDAIEFAKSEGLLAVEMEAAALYAFAKARGKSIVCFAHVTNQMGIAQGDFEKGEGDGSRDALEVIRLAALAWTDSSVSRKAAKAQRTSPSGQRLTQSEERKGFSARE